MVGFCGDSARMSCDGRRPDARPLRRRTAALATKRQLHDRCHARRARADAERAGNAGLDEHHQCLDRRAAIPPLLQCVAQRRVDVDARAHAHFMVAESIGTARRRSCRHRRLESRDHRRRHCAGRSHETDALHRSGRRQQRRPHRHVRRAAGADRPGRDTDDRHRLYGENSAPVRAHRRHRQLLLHRAMVSQDRRARCGRDLELPSVSCRHGVLLRLRRVRRAHDRPARLAGCGYRTAARAHGQSKRHDDASVLSRGCARLRMDDEPGFSRGARALRASRTAAGRHASALSARARVSGGASLRNSTGNAPILWRMVRRVPVRPPHDRRHSLADCHGRHGVPDPVHGRHAMADAARGYLRRRHHRP